MIETIVALLLIVNNEIVEHKSKQFMSDCLKGKRVAERQLKGGKCTVSMYPIRGRA